jgi:ArsR family transcriptional regulator, arsenate/arsenite/antimonite-responsive transcriptional repressor
MLTESVEFLKALCVETRIKIINLLKSQGPKGSLEIANSLGISPAAVSQHLKILKQVNLVKSQRQGFWIPYSVNEEVLINSREILGNLCRGECHSKVSEHKSGEIKDLESLRQYEIHLKSELQLVQKKIKKMEKK